MPPSATETTLLKLCPAGLAGAPAVAPEGRRRIPFGWGAFAVLPAAPGDDAAAALLRFVPDAVIDGPSRLRLTVASDDREVKTLRITPAPGTADAGPLALDLPYGAVMQTIELPLDAKQTAAAITHGVALSLSQGTTPLWLFHDDEPRGPGHAWLLPHLMPDVDATPAQRTTACFERFTSLASLQQFGWMEGCVLEGLEALAANTTHAERAARARDAIEQHLALFFPDNKIVYEDTHGNIADGAFGGIETMLMAAALARHRPSHPGIEQAITRWRDRADADGFVCDGNKATAEGCLTVAYPMSVIARQRGDRQLAQQAVTQLTGRLQRLRVGENLYLRHNAADDAHTYRNWARGVAWCLLGLARTTRELDAAGFDELTDPLKHGFTDLARWAMRHQREDGLWHCFLHEPETGAETSGSAGIAAALALAARDGYAPEGAADAAQRAWAGLIKHLTPDGMLGGVSQSNKREGGEHLQRNGYRTYSAMGTGLMAQLAAELGY